jgi:2-phosphoglycerate kinase
MYNEAAEKIRKNIENKLKRCNENKSDIIENTINVLPYILNTNINFNKNCFFESILNSIKFQFNK